MRLAHTQRIRASVVYLTLFLGASAASADSFTFYFEGTIDYIHDYLELDESVFIGAQFSGGYSFDPAGVSDQYPENPQVGLYYMGYAGHMWAQIGNYEFATDDLGIFITNDRPDVYEPISSSVSDAGGYQWSVMSIMLIDETRTALDSDALITTVPDLSDFKDFHGLLLDLPGDDLGIRGILTSLTPEPGSLGVLGMGILLMCGRRSR